MDAAVGRWILGGGQEAELPCSPRFRRIRVIVGLYVVLGLVAAVLAPAASALNLATVNSTSENADANVGDGSCDTGQLNAAGVPECTLRAAIQEANSDPARTRIHFNIPTSDSNHLAGVWTISPLSNLPDALFETDIDGATQPGTGTTPSIMLDGSLAGSARGLHLSATGQGSSLNQIAIGNFSRSGLEVASPDSIITGNIIGLDASGTALAPNGQDGITVFSTATDVNIGGFTAADGNVISGNGESGIDVHGGSSGVRINNNRVGTDVSGSVAMGNQLEGLRLTAANQAEIGNNGSNLISGNGRDGIHSTGHDSLEVLLNIIGLSGDLTTALPNGASGVELVGGTDASIGTVTQGNVIAANGGDGVTVAGGSNSEILGNYIGVAPSGVAVGNDGHGVFVNGIPYWHLERNTIAHNALDGVAAVNPRDRLGIAENDIYSNGGLAIDLGDDGVTPNDAGDSDIGVNDLLNFPTIVDVSGGQVTYELSAPAGSYTVFLYSNPSGLDPSGHGEAEQFVWRGGRSHPGGVAQYVLAPGVSAADNLSMRLVVNGPEEISSEMGPSSVFQVRVWSTRLEMPVTQALATASATPVQPTVKARPSARCEQRSKRAMQPVDPTTSGLTYRHRILVIAPASLRSSRARDCPMSLTKYSSTAARNLGGMGAR